MKLIRCVLLPAVSMLLCSALVLGGTAAVLSSTMPPFRDSVGDHNDTEKITGEYLVEISAAQDDTLLIFGSSELRTTYIPTHPANFFAGKRAGFQVDLIGRGSCQSLIHAIEHALLVSDIGINPTDDGRVIRLVFPAPTEERRRQLTKDVQKLGEETKVAVRNIRRDAMDKLKAQKKNSEITEDDQKHYEEEMQKITDKYVKLVDKACEEKNKEIMEI